MRKSSGNQLIVSVIIPAYNAEETLARCLDSFLSQSCGQFEIIIVNDGSTDSTKSIAEKYASIDSRFKVISQLNAGVSTARNRGLLHATGDIVAFVDSDDFVEPIYIEQLVLTFTEHTPDVVFFEFSRIDNEGNTISMHRLPNLVEDYYDNLIRLSEMDMFGYTWLKAYKKRVLEDIRFDESMHLFEDEVFTCATLQTPLKLSYIQKKLYNYTCVGSSSLSRRSHKDYYLLCDNVFRAWQNLLYGVERGTAFLARKAGHFQNVCKFYGLERMDMGMHFFRGLAECEFVKRYPSDDLLIREIQNKRWIIVIREILAYKVKTKMWRFLRN